MNSHRVLGFRKTETLTADAQKYFRRLHKKQSYNAVISRLPWALYGRINAWAWASLTAHLSYRRTPWARYPEGLYRTYKSREYDLRRYNQPRSPNHGQAVLVKDNLVTTRLPTTCASNMLRGFESKTASRVVQILHNHGMRVIGKTNMDEFGMGSHSTYSAFGPVYNGVQRRKQSVGGSSGGSAVAVAAGLAHIAIGSDTGGSVRLPAAYTGTFGFKPSYGRISRRGLIPYANSLDTVGIIAGTVLDVFLLFKILDLYDRHDPTSLNPQTRARIYDVLRERFWNTVDPRKAQDWVVRVTTKPAIPPVNDYEHREVETTDTPDEPRRHWATPTTAHRKRRIGVPDEYNIEELHPVVRQAWTRALSALSNQGHDIVPISLPHTKEALAAYYVLAPAEASSNLAKYDGVRYGNSRHKDSPYDDYSENPGSNGENILYAHHRGENFGDEVKRRILLGTFSLSADSMSNYFIQAQKIRRLVQEDFNLVFRMRHPLIEGSTHVSNGVDYVLCPTAPTPPPLFSELEEMDQFDSYVNDVFTVPASLAGLPALSFPAISDDDAPLTPDRNIGLQLIGQFGDDLSVINFARRFLEPIMNTQTIQGNRTTNRRLWDRPEIA